MKIGSYKKIMSRNGLFTWCLFAPFIVMLFLCSRYSFSQSSEVDELYRVSSFEELIYQTILNQNITLESDLDCSNLNEALCGKVVIEDLIFSHPRTDEEVGPKEWSYNLIEKDSCQMLTVELPHSRDVLSGYGDMFSGALICNSPIVSSGYEIRESVIDELDDYYIKLGRSCGSIGCSVEFILDCEVDFNNCN